MGPIPKQIHLIWVGGDIPERNKACVITHKPANLDWDINLWIDRNQLLSGFRRAEMATHYKGQNVFGPSNNKVTADQWKEMREEVGTEGDDATIGYLKTTRGLPKQDLKARRADNLLSIRNFCVRYWIKLRYVDELETAKNFPIYREEMAARGTNFGAASDILRLEILYKHGGVYLDTDVKSVHAFGSIDAHQSYPRFSAVHPIWSPGNAQVTKNQWDDNTWWQQVKPVPKISNSTIASHAKCDGLKKYRKLITRNYEGLSTSDDMRAQYETDIRRSTLQMTGPTAAEKGSGYEKLYKKQEAKADELGFRSLDEAARKTLESNLYMRDNWWFPMYLISDLYFHDWL